MAKAQKERRVYAQIFDDFKKDLRPENVKKWIEEVTKWEEDMRIKDPYDLESSGEQRLLDFL